jgi:2-amino-4-hydroxy-6-hydroxymethyldihydropteridine diphosphokinase
MGQDYQSFLIALGGNQQSDSGPPARTLRAAIARLQQQGAVVAAVSPFYATPCFPAGAGPDYVNAAARISLPGGAAAALALLHRIEADFGRARDRRWGQRTLDLDLLAMGDTVLPDATVQAQWRALPLEDQMRAAPDDLILPHPRIQDRAFVLVPLADVAPDWVHPLLQLSVRDMRDALDPADVAAVLRLE